MTDEEILTQYESNRQPVECWTRVMLSISGTV